MAEPFVYSGPARLFDGYRVRPQSIQGSVRAYLVEGIGTCLLTLAAGASICVESVHGTLGDVGIALIQGASYAALSLFFAHISGGQFNPAITVALVSVRRQRPIHGAFYLVAQLLGACLAGGLLRGMFGRYTAIGSPAYLGTPTLAPELSPLEGMGLEALFGFLLVSALFATVIDPRGNKRAAPFALGLVLFVGVLGALHITGAAFNPARAFGTALASMHWVEHQIYWAGPLLGGMLAAGFYEFVLLRPLGTPTSG
ncbi:MAG: aquaporin [Elusimicrobia bacterium]|nr:aquaporin [Elusimicrobiota bacterium]